MAKAQWRNKRAILRDLARVTQGHVPVNINEAITADRPPTQIINEEIDEEYLRYSAGDATFTEGPDLPMIREMLSMVDYVNGKSTEEEARNLELEITKVTPLQSTHQSSTSSVASKKKLSPSKAKELAAELNGKIHCQPKTVKAKRERNVAIASLLKVYAGIAPLGYESPKEDSPSKQGIAPKHDISPVVGPPKQDSKSEGYPKGADVKSPVHWTPSCAEKVDRWLNQGDQTPTKGPKVDRWMNQGERTPTKGPMLCADAFKVKKTQRVAVEKPSLPKPKPVISAAPPDNSGYGKFVPSPYAAELYNTLVQNKETAERIKEDIWKQAERQMRELEAKRALEAKIEEEISEVVRSLQDSDDGEQGLTTLVLDNGVEMQIPPDLCLPQHRHKLTGTCQVCQSLASYKIKTRENSSSTVKNYDRSLEQPKIVQELSVDEPNKINLVITSTELKTKLENIENSVDEAINTKFKIQMNFDITSTEINTKLKNIEHSVDEAINAKSKESIKEAKNATAKVHKLTDTCVPTFKESFEGTENAPAITHKLTGTCVPDFTESIEGTENATAITHKLTGTCVPDFKESFEGTENASATALKLTGTCVPDFKESIEGTENAIAKALKLTGTCVPDFWEDLL